MNWNDNYHGIIRIIPVHSKNPLGVVCKTPKYYNMSISKVEDKADIFLALLYK